MITRFITRLFELAVGAGFGAAPAGEAIEAELAAMQQNED